MAIIFPLSALLILLAWLYTQNVIRINALLIGLLCISLSTTENLVRPWLSALGTYRLGNPLTQENVLIKLGQESLGISTDQQTVTALSQFVDLLNRNGFQPGTPTIDFSGYSPGLMYIAKGRPIGVIWLLGNTPGADAAARFILSIIKPKDLRRAWLLTSTDHYYRIDQWQDMLKKQAPESSWVAVGSVVFPQAQWRQLDDPKLATITVWRPAE